MITSAALARLNDMVERVKALQQQLSALIHVAGVQNVIRLHLIAEKSYLEERIKPFDPDCVQADAAAVFEKALPSGNQSAERLFKSMSELIERCRSRLSEVNEEVCIPPKEMACMMAAVSKVADQALHAIRSLRQSHD